MEELLIKTSPFQTENLRIKLDELNLVRPLKNGSIEKLIR